MEAQVSSDIGLIGLAVMGKNLVLNMLDHGFNVSVYNRSPEKTSFFLNESKGYQGLNGCFSLEEFVSSLARPCKIMLMIQAGKPVDACIEQLIPLLHPGDIIIDGGNSLFTDTERRCKYLESLGIHFIGCGISGGEEGARKGPSIMPGGHFKAWEFVAPILTSIAAKTEQGDVCCSWMGNGGAGHYVKAVHNGIEYGDMQLICEAYALLKFHFKLSTDEIAEIFSQWNKRELNSYLIEITSDILSVKNEQGEYVIDTILDVAGQKGTGKWIGNSALELGAPLSLIVESVLARYLSSYKEERIQASKMLPQHILDNTLVNREEYIEHIFDALYASKIISYSQGFMLLKKASEEFAWDLNLGEIALVWRSGCIIKSAFLGDIYDSFSKNHSLPSLMMSEFFSKALNKVEMGWRKTVSHAISQGISIPCLASALTFYDGYRTSNSSASLIQGLRDYFGAHTYEKIGHPRGEFYHTDWIHSKETSQV